MNASWVKLQSDLNKLSQLSDQQDPLLSPLSLSSLQSILNCTQLKDSFILTYTFACRYVLPLTGRIVVLNFVVILIMFQLHAVIVWILKIWHGKDVFQSEMKKEEGRQEFEVKETEVSLVSEHEVRAEEKSGEASRNYMLGRGV